MANGRMLIKTILVMGFIAPDMPVSGLKAGPEHERWRRTLASFRRLPTPRSARGRGGSDLYCPVKDFAKLKFSFALTKSG